ncbi:MAG: PspC domain-containing protein [Ardenticatenaceae bacterium]|nr:PspC domain-containing protein [Anaerolineales bacterium]MCB8941081.1 PspC domain-containing protein [Ardenticatenaceae bacterium]MCB8972422.1 PspC domain-containing protein [Ardenticatenaceae bacterium]
MNAKDNRLRRQNGIFLGVCGGLAAWTGINVFWFRLLFFILLLPGGASAIPYFILWLVMPKK